MIGQLTADEIRTAAEPLHRLHSGEIYGCASCYRQEPCRDRTVLDAALAYADLLKSDRVVSLFRQGGLSSAYYPDDTETPDGYFIPAGLLNGSEEAVRS